VWEALGALHPVVEPLRAWDSHLDFDRAVCDAGVKSFIRPVMKSDVPEHLVPVLGEDATHVFVARISDDERIRIGFSLEESL
jgi:hypothetical protein